MKRGPRRHQIPLIIVICKLNLLRPEMALKPQHQLVHPELKLTETEVMVVQVQLPVQLVDFRLKNP